SSQIFSVCGLPEVKIHKLKPKAKGDPVMYQVELLGLDVFDPITMKTDHWVGDDVPAWFLDTDYNGLCFHVSQAFFPRTGAWEHLKKALKGDYEESVWDHLAGTVSAPFEAGEHGQIAVKVIDQRGNELLVVKSLKEAEIVLTQEQADRLIALMKEAMRTDAFVWEINRRQDELVAAVEDRKIQFVLTLKRNPFEF